MPLISMHALSPPRRPLLLSLVALFASVAVGLAQAVPPVLRPASLPGAIAVEVDATDLDQRIFRVRQALTVAPGALTLLYPKWIPGTHAPSASVASLAGLQIRAGEQRLDWQRDPADPSVFRLTVPAGVKQLQLQFEVLNPVEGSGRSINVTRDMLAVRWQSTVLYPAGMPVSAISVVPSVRLPAKWQAATALRLARTDADTWHYAQTTLETLVDSPLYAGAHMKRVPLDAPGAARPVTLHVLADDPSLLTWTDAQMDAHRKLVQQADTLFGVRRFAHYEFLLVLSERFGRIGLEHHQSSENAVRPTYFKDWDKRVASRELLPHEYVHSWNGKFRRPKELTTPDFNAPMRTGLLWVYEGQTQFWGWVLAARSGLITQEQARDNLAQIAAAYEARAGRQWRNLQDTTQEPLIRATGVRSEWFDYTRGADYYDESVLLWLAADTQLRSVSGKSMDDFARAFFGGNDGGTPELGPKPYEYQEVLRTLETLAPLDWNGFLRSRLDTYDSTKVLEGLARSGWRLKFVSTPPFPSAEGDGEDGDADFRYSLGLRIGKDGKLTQVQWDSPAFRAKLSTAMSVVAVNGRAYKPALLREAITAAATADAKPIELLLREGDLYRTVPIAYRGGLRYPTLERITGTEDRLSALLAPR